MINDKHEIESGQNSLRWIISAFFRHFKYSIFELYVKKETDIDKIQIFTLKKQYSYLIIFAIAMQTYFCIFDIIHESPEFYIFEICYILTLLISLWLLNRIRDNFLRPVVSLMLTVTPVILLERCLAMPNMYNSYSICIVFLTSEIIFLSIIANQKYLCQVVQGTFFHIFLYYKIQNLDSVRFSDLIFFFSSLLLLAILKGASTNIIRREISILRLNEEDYDMLIKSTTHLMKVVISCPVYILSLENFENISEELSKSEKGKVGGKDIQYLRTAITTETSNLKYFDQDDETMEKVTTEGIFQFIEDLYFDSTSIFTIELDENHPNIRKEFEESTEEELRRIFEEEVSLREKIAGLDFKGQNAADIFLSIYKLLCDYKMSTRGYKIKLQDISNKKYLGDNSDLKYYDIEMIFETYKLKNSIIIIMKDERNRYDLNELRVENESKEAVLAAIVHDMRAPLHGIMGYSDLLCGEETLEKGLLDHVFTIKTNAEHLKMLVSDILDSTRLKKGKFNLEQKLFDLSEMIKECVKVGRQMCKDKKIAILSKCPDSLRIVSDEHRLKRVILNLLTNAIKFTTEGMIVITVVEKQGQVVNISISDTGAGMKKSTLKNLFKAFNSYNDASGNLNKDGIGLGLAISLAIVQKIGPDDRIDVKSKLGHGSSFSFNVYQDVSRSKNMNRDRGKLKTLFKKKSVFDDIMERNNIKSPRRIKNYPSRDNCRRLVKKGGGYMRSAINLHADFLSSSNNTNNLHKRSYHVGDKSDNGSNLSNNKSNNDEFMGPEKLKTWSNGTPMWFTSKLASESIEKRFNGGNSDQKKNKLKPILEDTSDKSDHHKALETEERCLVDDSYESIKEIPRTQNKKNLSRKVSDSVSRLSRVNPSHNILLLDDEEININLLDHQIKKIQKNNKDIKSELNIYKAIDMVVSNLEKNVTFSLVMTDFNLDNDHTGLEFVKKVKKIYKAHGIPRPVFFLISGEDFQKSEMKEFDEILQKAYGFKKFEKLMKKWYKEQTDRDIAEEGIHTRFKDRLPSGFLSQKKIKNKRSLHSKKQHSSHMSNEPLHLPFEVSISDNKGGVCDIPMFARIKKSTKLDDI